MNCKFPRKRMQIVAFLLFIAMLLVSVFPVPSFASTDEAYITVTVYKSANRIVTAKIRKEDYKRFSEDLKKGLIPIPGSKLNESTPHGSTPFGFVPPDHAKLISEHYMDYSKVKAEVERRLGSTPNLAYYGSQATIGFLLKKLGAPTVLQWIINGAFFAGENLTARQDSWWTESLIMILNQSITGVRQRIYQNTSGGYPAAWNIIERY